MANEDRDPHGLVPDTSKTVLLILDLISDFEFEDGEKIFRAALPVAMRILRLKQRARAAGIPAVYVNDGAERWRSDFPALVLRCSDSQVRGAPIARALRPEADDYCVLKPKHSGFFATPLDTLIEYMGATRLILTGISSNQCVLFTANDAYVRDLELVIPRDCISARTPGDTRFALRYFTNVLGADTRPSKDLRLPPRESRRRSAKGRRGVRTSSKRGGK
jgi:nicotinamidase-related amidase